MAHSRKGRADLFRVVDNNIAGDIETLRQGLYSIVR